MIRERKEKHKMIFDHASPNSSLAAPLPFLEHARGVPFPGPLQCLFLYLDYN